MVGENLRDLSAASQSDTPTTASQAALPVCETIELNWIEYLLTIIHNTKLHNSTGLQNSKGTQN